ncbi:hypothetical protein XELAEV_18013709mg [Xenopus laevis]|uniref:Uncharacterized protein n=1 Tax=Xenopus laevis TaxID=8355 RepID=A0A974HZV6_XENLA|nr:hypothetical protein XELAEV_18013709mg [Xenopus laevis]
MYYDSAQQSRVSAWRDWLNAACHIMGPTGRDCAPAAPRTHRVQASGTAAACGRCTFCVTPFYREVTVAIAATALGLYSTCACDKCSAHVHVTALCVTPSVTIITERCNCCRIPRHYFEVDTGLFD